MNTPPFLLGAALIFWGWQIDLPWLGALLALVLEGARGVKSRWDLAQTDLDRVWNLCVALFLGVLAVAFVQQDGAGAVAEYFNTSSSGRRLASLNKTAQVFLQLWQWLPIALLPLAVAQAYGQRDVMDWSTFSWWLRRRRHLAQARLGPAGINVSFFLYFAVCLFAASAANRRNVWFLPGLAALLLAALWQQRSRTFARVAWGTAAVLAVILGLLGQQGLFGMKTLLGRLDHTLVARLWGGRGVDDRTSRTAIGTVGRQKLSGRIVLRLEGQPPPRLREASYNWFKSPLWACSKREFNGVPGETNETTWLLRPDRTPHRTVNVAGYLDSGVGPLALPHGVARLDEANVFLVETNHFATVRARAPGFVRFHASYEENSSLDTPPTDEDRELPTNERAALQQVVNDLGLEGMSDERKVLALGDFFTGNFKYSTWRDVRHLGTTNQTPLAAFLLRHRTGHCEYFATATTLLLRAAGVPARYAVGYAVAEQKGRRWIVRERHAHAWSLAWVNGAWREVDHTPASWHAADESEASWWEPVSDFFSRLWFEFNQWRFGTGQWKRYLVWFAFPVLAVAAWRLYHGRRWGRTNRGKNDLSAPTPRVGMDSEFFEIERVLTRRGFERQPGETHAAWLERLREQSALDVAPMSHLLGLHERLRFDPEGLSVADRAALRDGARTLAGRLGG